MSAQLLAIGPLGITIMPLMMDTVDTTSVRTPVAAETMVRGGLMTWRRHLCHLNGRRRCIRMHTAMTARAMVHLHDPARLLVDIWPLEATLLEQE